MATSLNDATNLAATADANTLAGAPTFIALLQASVAAHQEMHNWGGAGKDPNAAFDRANALNEVFTLLANWTTAQKEAFATRKGAPGVETMNVHFAWTK